MSPSPQLLNENDIYLVITDYVLTFLSQNGYEPLTLEDEDFVLKKSKKTIRIPRNKVITKTQLIDILDEAAFDLKMFEAFALQILLDKSFEDLIDMSLKTPPLPKKN